MKQIYKISIFIFSIAISTHLKAQFVGGNSTIDLTFIEYKKDYGSDRYSEVKGLPYLLKEWATGSIKSSNNIEKKDLMLNFDEVRNELLIKGSTGQLLNVSPPAIEFKILDNDLQRKFKLGFKQTKSTDITTFFEVLVDGNAKFLKRNKKGISENKEYSGAIVKSITDDIRYFLVITNNEPIQVKLDQKAILALLPNKDVELTAYIKDNKLNLKKQEDVVKLVEYYNKIN